MLSFISFILVILLFVSLNSLRKRVASLESKISAGSSIPNFDAPVPSPHLLPHTSPTQGPENRYKSPVPTSSYNTQASDPVFFNWLKEDWLLKLGILLLILGFGWFVSYAFIHDWIGPLGRVLFGVVVGVVFMAVGLWRIGRYSNQGQSFLILGSAIVHISFFAGISFYNIFPLSFTLIVLLLCNLFVGLVSIKYNSQILAVLSLIFAGIAPALTIQHAFGFEVLWYMLAVVLATTFISSKLKNRFLMLIALIFASAYAVDLVNNLNFVFAFAIISYASTFYQLIKNDLKSYIVDFFIALFTTLWVISAIHEVVSVKMQSTVLVAWAVALTVVGAILIHYTRRIKPFAIFGTMSAILVFFAIIIEFNYPEVVYAILVEIIVIVFLAHHLLKNINYVEKVSYLFAIPLLLSFEALVSSYWRDSVFHKDSLLILFEIIIFFVIASIFFKVRKSEGNLKEKHTWAAFAAVATMLSFAWIWLSLHALMPKETATMLSLALFTVFGLIAYIKGVFGNIKELSLCGGVVIGAVVLRLLVIDIWQMSVGGRVVTFFVIGILLISTAFLKRSKKSITVTVN
jgi:uncharacterized membrane protein